MTKNTLPLLTFFAALFFAIPAFGQPEIVPVVPAPIIEQPLRVENFVRLKGQESTIIRGVGMVSGLPGTGDDPKNYNPVNLAHLRMLSRSGMFGSNERGVQGSRNNALVAVTVSIPPGGARDGEMLDCTVVSIGNAESLAGGILSPTALGTSLPQDENSPVLGMAQGRISIEDAATTTVGRITEGGQLRAEFKNKYIKDGWVTLVLKKELARPKLANKIADTINAIPEFYQMRIRPAKALSSTDVIVQMPQTYNSIPLDFIEMIMDAEVMNPPVAIPRVTINERTGVIVIDENVEVKPIVVTHPNFIIDVEPPLAPGEMEQFPRQFIDLDTNLKYRQMSGENVNNLKLKALQTSMNSLRATPQDVIDVIKILHAQGAIMGEVVYIND